MRAKMHPAAKSLPLSAVILLLAALLGCSTEKALIVQSQTPIQRQSYQGFTVELTFLDEATLRNRHGNENNPFITAESALKLYTFMVFELRARYDAGAAGKSEAPAPLTLVLGKAEIQFGGKSEHPSNRFHLNGFWEKRIGRQKIYERWDARRVANAINRNVLDNKTDFTPEETWKSGYMVFTGNFPTYGEAKVYVPLFTKNERMFHNFDFTFQF